MIKAALGEYMEAIEMARECAAKVANIIPSEKRRRREFHTRATGVPCLGSCCRVCIRRRDRLACVSRRDLRGGAVITQDDIDAAKEYYSGQFGGVAVLAQHLSKYRIASENAQSERDAQLVEAYPSDLGDMQTVGIIRSIAKAIRDQAATPLQNGGVG
jgi:hypothetical protein